jgi:hypothetical protein
MAMILESMVAIAEEVARALVKVSSRGNADAARLSLPLVYPGGSMVGIEISRLRDGFLVSDVGGARREAGLLGGEKAFQRIAVDVANKFAIRFDSNMMFDLNVREPELVVAVVAVANAAKTAVENTLIHLASVDHADYRAMLWDRLEGLYGHPKVNRKPKIIGASDRWDFDAAIVNNGRVAVFELVVPNTNSVNSAVTKFLDVRDLGQDAPARVAVLTSLDATPHLSVLSRTAQILTADASDEAYLKAA